MLFGSLCGSALISLINIKAVHIFHTPHQCITIPAVIPIVPGVLMYRALYGFMELQGVVGEVTSAMSFAINGSLVLFCIALGCCNFLISLLENGLLHTVEQSWSA